jgi:hypothetical protein
MINYGSGAKGHIENPKRPLTLTEPLPKQPINAVYSLALLPRLITTSPCRGPGRLTRRTSGPSRFRPSSAVRAKAWRSPGRGDASSQFRAFSSLLWASNRSQSRRILPERPQQCLLVGSPFHQWIICGKRAASARPRWCE